MLRAGGGVVVVVVGGAVVDGEDAAAAGVVLATGAVGSRLRTVGGAAGVTLVGPEGAFLRIAGGGGLEGAAEVVEELSSRSTFARARSRRDMRFSLRSRGPRPPGALLGAGEGGADDVGVLCC